MNYTISRRAFTDIAAVSLVTYGGAVLVAVLEAVAVDTEMVGAALLVSITVLPSIVVCSAINRLSSHASRGVRIVFGASFLACFVALIYSRWMKTADEAARDVIWFFVVAYLSQLVAAYAVLYFLRPKMDVEKSSNSGQ